MEGFAPENWLRLVTAAALDISGMAQNIDAETTGQPETNSKKAKKPQASVNKRRASTLSSSDDSPKRIRRSKTHGGKQSARAELTTPASSLAQRENQEENSSTPGDDKL